MLFNLPEPISLSVGEAIEPRNGHVHVSQLGKLLVGRIGKINGKFVVLDEADEPPETYPAIFDKKPGEEDEMFIKEVNAYSVKIRVGSEK